MTILAKFIGANSLGYEKGKQYQLRLANCRGVSITRFNGKGKCLYQSLSAFLKNWNNILICSLN